MVAGSVSCDGTPAGGSHNPPKKFPGLALGFYIAIWTGWVSDWAVCFEILG
jgi:hypothetical protein